MKPSSFISQRLGRTCLPRRNIVDLCILLLLAVALYLQPIQEFVASFVRSIFCAVIRVTAEAKSDLAQFVGPRPSLHVVLVNHQFDAAHRLRAVFTNTNFSVSVQRIYANAHQHLLDDVLRDQVAFGEVSGHIDAVTWLERLVRY